MGEKLGRIGAPGAIFNTEPIHITEFTVTKLYLIQIAIESERDLLKTGSVIDQLLQINSV